MSVRNLDSIFQPRRIAVIGASDDPSSVGGPVFRNLISSGFRGVVYPVNVRRESVEGVQAYPSVSKVPNKPDLAVVCTPAKTVPAIVRECGEAGVQGMIIISAGFRESGADGKELEQQVADEVARFDGMRVVGPNCLGVIVPGLRMNASFAATTPADGHIAFVSQSGALCTAVLDWADEEGIGFSHFVSVGNMLDADFGDLLDYFSEDPATKSVILYVESIKDARKFMSATRAFSRTKPIVAFKSGRFAESAAAAASHTGAMAGEDAVYDAAFERAGIVRISEIDEMFDCAELLAHHKPPTGSRLAILTNAGGPGVMATDALLARHGTLAKLSDDTIASLNDILPPYWSHGNPIDVLGDAPPERIAESARLVLDDDGVDAVLVILAPQAMTDPTEAARAVAKVGTDNRYKPLLAAWIGGRMMREGTQLLSQAKIPTYTTPEQAVHAFMHLVSYARNQEVLHETPRDLPVSFSLDRERLRGLFDTILMEGQDVLSETVSKALLEGYEIPVTKPYAAHSADEAVQAARRIEYPVVLKVLSPDITHKTDVGGVVVNLKSDDEVRQAYEQIITGAKDKRPDANVLGVTVQAMVKPEGGAVEMIIGAKKDPTFGTVVMAGMGGIAAEVFKDRTLGLPPLSERLARRMLESLDSWPLLGEYRGRPALDKDALIETLMRVSYLVADYPEIKELDINPLIVKQDGVVALDARVVIDRSLVTEPGRPYQHLAIRPYPDQYVRNITLSDGERVKLRPIKPEDEPMWHDLLASCSEGSLWFRFRHLFKKTTHQMASRYCFIDYDREMAIVSEMETADGNRVLSGVVRLVADADHESAEYAVLIGDPWQGRGLGSAMTDYILDIARQWGVKRLYAETTSDNARMIGMFRNRGFEVKHSKDDDTLVLADLKLE
ncbi:MAG: bifunctional acetate--CoA ligase family protein/GNAT family N-acetyltransferase [Planctomycetes bacterium]|nr:bifunctional acetate--CoA ligase family protein/GNAT family N-acetyltransferase [Planctomycetota bacterium]